MVKPKMKALDLAEKNYTGAASSVPQKYKDGINAGKSWKDNAQSAGAEQRYQDAMTRVIQNRSRVRGLEQVTESDWKSAALDKGAAQIGTAMQKSGTKWHKKYQPYHDTVANVDMAEKTSDAMANIDGRLKPIVQAQIEKKRELKG
jgi:hypothetical protein